MGESILFLNRNTSSIFEETAIILNAMLQMLVAIEKLSQNTLKKVKIEFCFSVQEIKTNQKRSEVCNDSYVFNWTVSQIDPTQINI